VQRKPALGSAAQLQLEIGEKVRHIDSFRHQVFQLRAEDVTRSVAKITTGRCRIRARARRVQHLGGLVEEDAQIRQPVTFVATHPAAWLSRFASRKPHMSMGRAGIEPARVGL
jgi:hypothetical protein